MKIAIKFSSQGNYQSHCTDFGITDLKQVVPSNEGFEFYDITKEQLADIHYLKLINGVITLDEQAKQSDIDKATKAQEISLKRTRLKALSEDLIQAMAGETVPNLLERKQEFMRLHNELRAYENKPPRETQEEIL